MHAERTQQSLEAVLSEEVLCTEHLLKSLESERAALTRRDSNALGRSTEEKLAHVQKLETLERDRERLLSELGFTGDPEQLAEWLDHQPQAARGLRELWQQVLANTRACRTSNLTNGGILEASRQHVEQALAVLRGHTGSASTYDPNGATPSSLGQRELGKV